MSPHHQWSDLVVVVSVSIAGMAASVGIRPTLSTKASEYRMIYPSCTRVVWLSLSACNGHVHPTAGKYLHPFSTVGMLACRLDVDVSFSVFLTILSAFIAVVFTFAALASPYASEAIDNSAPMRTLSRWHSEICFRVISYLTPQRPLDPEAGLAMRRCIRPTPTSMLQCLVGRSFRKRATTPMGAVTRATLTRKPLVVFWTRRPTPRSHHQKGTTLSVVSQVIVGHRLPSGIILTSPYAPQ